MEDVDDDDGGGDGDVGGDSASRLQKRVAALHSIDVAQTHACLLRHQQQQQQRPRQPPLGSSLDEFKMQLHVEMAQCHFQAGELDAALSALCVALARGGWRSEERSW